MSMLRPYPNNTKGDGLYFPVIQSDPRTDMYKKGILPDHISAQYRKKQKLKINKNPFMDKIDYALLQPLGTPSAVSMMGSGKNKSKSKHPKHQYLEGVQSKKIAFFNEVGMSAKKAPKPVKGTLAKLGTVSVAREPVYHPKINRYVK